jgi:hypothetical protein
MGVVTVGPVHCGRVEIDLGVLCSVGTDRVEAFTALLRESICLLEESSLASLRTTVILEDKLVASTVRTIIKTVEPSAPYAPRDVDAANAATVPVKNRKGLACLIVLGKTLLDSLDWEHNHPAETVSAVLEELLHVWVYTPRVAKAGLRATPRQRTRPLRSTRAHHRFLDMR